MATFEAVMDVFTRTLGTVKAMINEPFEINPRVKRNTAAIAWAA